MPRSKDYRIGESRREISGAATDFSNALKADASDARFSMAALLGPTARFGSTTRNIDLIEWLGRGIDPWVFATVACLKAMLISGTHQSTSIERYAFLIRYFFEFIESSLKAQNASCPMTPAALSPLHMQAFIAWLRTLALARDWAAASPRGAFKATKSVVLEMFAQGFIAGDPSRYFPRAPFPWREPASRHTSLSDREQESLAKAVKTDLSALHHGRLTLRQNDVQALRLLVVAHRQGLNPTPLLEMRRDALTPGFLPGTVRIRTAKHRNKKVRSSVGSAAKSDMDLIFSLAEGVVLQQAIETTSDLVEKATPGLKNRVWLFRSDHYGKGRVSCLTLKGLGTSIAALVQRHALVGDDGNPLQINLSRLRKSFFDRALRAADGDVAITANLMGNTPQVAGYNYPSMNEARQREAAAFMNGDYTAIMKREPTPTGQSSTRVVRIRPDPPATGRKPGPPPIETPVSACHDTLNGEHAPRDGHSHCDRYVMCVFCSSFAVVGSVEELWRLFSFQSFARAELNHLDEALGSMRTPNDSLEDLRDRYRLAIPFIDDFTWRQFAKSRVAKARAQASRSIHPYWQYQMKMSTQARNAVQGNGGPAAGTVSGDDVGT